MSRRIAEDRTSVRSVPTRYLAGIALALVLISGALRIVRPGPLGDIAAAFSVQLESSIPTWFSSLLLLLAGVVVWQLVLMSSQQSDQGPGKRPLLVALTIGFTYMSIDEAATLHERLINAPLHASLNGTGFFLYEWVIIGIPIVVAVIFIYSRWVWSLPTEVRRLVILGAALFVIGSIGFEMVSAQFTSQAMATGSDDSLERLAALSSHVEELGEMLGVVFFIEGMLRYLRSFGWDGALRLSRPPAPARATE